MVHLGVRPSTGLGSCVFRAWLTPYLSLCSTCSQSSFIQSQTHSPTGQHLCPSWPQRPNILMQIILTSPAGCADPRTPRAEWMCWAGSPGPRGICKYHPPVFPWMEIALSLLQMAQNDTGLVLLLFLSYEFMRGFCFWIFQLDGKHSGSRHQLCSCISMMYFYWRHFLLSWMEI